MKKYFVITAGIAAMACQVVAQQIKVSVVLSYSTFIVGEPALVQAKVENLLREPLEFGEGAKDLLFFEVCKGDWYNELTPESDKPFIRPFSLAPGQTLARPLEIDKWFSLYDNGKYLIRAVVVHNSIRYESAAKAFDVIPGVSLKEGLQMFAHKKQQKRHFKLVHWERNQVSHLFLRIEDEPDGLVWDTIDLGAFSKTDEPKLDIAPDGEVTVFHRANSDGFLRTVIWSLPDSVEIAERNPLIDPEVAARHRLRANSSDGQRRAEEKKSSWWKFW